MAQAPVTKQQARQAVEAVGAHGSIKAAAEALGIPRPTMQNRLKRAKQLYDLTPKHYEHDPLPDAALPDEELVERRKRQYAQLDRAERARKLIEIRMKIDGPIGIIHFGDPHVDDDGTDIGALERHTEIARTTEGLFAANLGDTTNNWVGRLARLYGEQSTSAKEAIQLATWFVKRCDWLYMVGGNHDGWSGAGDPLKWIAAQSTSLYEPFGIRIKLIFRNGREVRINARHDFTGHSMWNPAHGAMKAAQMGWRDHLLTNGHKHTSGYGVVKDPATGILSHSLQVASYKIHDRYAKEKSLLDQHISPAAVTVINPYAKDEVSLITVFFDVEEGADYLEHKRRKWGG